MIGGEDFFRRDRPQWDRGFTFESINARMLTYCPTVQTLCCIICKDKRRLIPEADMFLLVIK
jgi:hypothetical protein